MDESTCDRASVSDKLELSTSVKRSSISLSQLFSGTSKTQFKYNKARGGMIGRKKARHDKLKQRRKNLAFKNGSSTADSMKKRAEVMEDQNSIQAFLIKECLTEDDEKDRNEFNRLIIKKRLMNINKSVKE